MEGSFDNRERRRYPRILTDLPVGYRDANGPCLRGAIVVNASEGGFLIEATRDISVGTELNITVLFPKGFRLADFKVLTKIVWKKPYSKEDLKGNQYWKGYHYGLEFIQISDKDRWKVNLVFGGRFESEKNPPVKVISFNRELGEMEKIKVVVHFSDGKLIKGFTEDFFPNKERFHLIPADNPSGGAIEVSTRDLKAMFIVRDFIGDSLYNERKTYIEGEKPSGKKVEVTFMDGEVLVGSTLGYDSKRQGFFIIPADPKSNNIRVYAVSSGVKKVRYA